MILILSKIQSNITDYKLVIKLLGHSIKFKIQSNSSKIVSHV